MSKVISCKSYYPDTHTHTHTHTHAVPTAQPGPLNWPVLISDLTNVISPQSFASVFPEKAKIVTNLPPNVKISFFYTRIYTYYRFG